MEDSTYRKVLYYNLVDLYVGINPITVDVSKYKFMKGFAVRPGFQSGSVYFNDISATYLNTSNLNFTITQQISNSVTGPNASSKSIFGGGSGVNTSCCSGKVIPYDSLMGHTLCRGGSSGDSTAAKIGYSWLWYPYRLLSLTFDAPVDNAPVYSGLMIFF
jgi:hypothetical protein